ncbi:MAG: hypothetical protein AB1793_03845 [Candidatus Thermoplasmatota archaeon]
MPNLKDEIDEVVRDSSRKLLRVAPPPVLYWLLFDVLARPPDDPALRAAAEACRTYPPRLALMAAIREDGTWPISPARKSEEDAGPGPPYGWTYITMLRNLGALGDSLTTMDEGRVGRCVERILGWQTKEGYIPGPRERFPLPHYNGYALRNTVLLGAGDDPRVRRLRDWLYSIQREDGGWLIPYMQDLRYLPEYRHMRTKDFLRLVNGGLEYDPGDPRLRGVPSCVWTTMMVVRGMSATIRPTRDRRALRGADFVLDGFFKRNHHANFFGDEGHWTKLKYPTHYGSGLCALDILTFLGFGPDDERMDRPIRWILGARSKDGFWMQSDRPHPEKDLWITEVALSILARYSRMY